MDGGCIPCHPSRLVCRLQFLSLPTKGSSQALTMVHRCAPSQRVVKQVVCNSRGRKAVANYTAPIGTEAPPPKTVHVGHGTPTTVPSGPSSSAGPTPF